MKNITLGDCAEALDRLCKKRGYMYNPTEQEILDEAKTFKQSQNYKKVKS